MICKEGRNSVCSKWIIEELSANNHGNEILIYEGVWDGWYSDGTKVSSINPQHRERGTFDCTWLLCCWQVSGDCCLLYSGHLSHHSHTVQFLCMINWFEIFLWIRPWCHIHICYSVTQSYVNSFWGYVVLDTSNNVFRDEYNILDQIYIKQICPVYIMMIFDFYNIIRICILTLN